MGAQPEADQRKQRQEPKDDRDHYRLFLRFATPTVMLQADSQINLHVFSSETDAVLSSAFERRPIAAPGRPETDGSSEA